MTIHIIQIKRWMKSAGSIFIAILLSLCCAVGQENEMDSLRRIIENQQHDTGKIKSMLEISRKYSRIDRTISLEMCDEAELLAGELNYGKGIAGAWFERSIVYLKTGSLDSAILFNERSMQINDSLQIYDQLAHNYNLLGNMLLNKNMTFSAMESFQMSLMLFKKVSDSTGISFVYNSLGNLNEKEGNYDSAAYYYFKYLELSENMRQEEQLGIGLINLANVYIMLGDYTRAAEYSDQSIDINQKYGRSDLIIYAYKYLGIINAKNRKYDESLRYFNLGLDLAEKLDFYSEIASLYINMGNMYEERFQFDNAFTYYEKAIELGRNLGNSRIMVSGLLNKGLIYERKKNYDMALLYYDSCVQLLSGSGLYYELASAYFNIYKIYELTGDNKNALLYQTKYYTLKDSSINIEAKRDVADMTLKYEREKDQARLLTYENSSLEQEMALERRTRQRNTYLFSGLGIVLLLIFVISYYSQRSRKNRIIAEQRIQQLEEEKKLLAARFLVEGQEEERKRIAKELHDGLGVLLSSAKMHFTTIRAKIPENKILIDKAAKLIEQATGDVRRISHNMMPGLLTKFGMYEAIKELFEQLEDMENIKAILNIEGNQSRLPENTEIMLYRVIQEMVNNTLKHADAKTIKLDIRIRTEMLTGDYSDDGKGFDATKYSEIKSLGLKSIQSRIKFLGGIVELDTEPDKGIQYRFEVPVS